MTSVFRRVALIGKYQPQGARAHDPVMDEIGDFLSAQGCEVVLEQSSAGCGDAAVPPRACRHPVMSVEEIGEQCDLGLVVGGDGTMLGIGRQLAPFGVPLIGINRGRLGFITDIALDEYQDALRPMLAGEYDEDHRSLIQASVMRDGQSVFEAVAMNDVVVNRGATSGMVELRVSVGKAFVANQRADGLIIATSTGSTAYALSAGGPLLHPSIPGWIMVPIAPHTLSNRPILLPDAEEVTIEVVNDRDASANFDMQSLASLRQGDRIVVRRSDFHVRFLHPRGWSYFDTLRRKMHWNKGDN
ncbi:NAD kinase [Xenophilus arseniciresistens]|uniref:NAD kinase n=1 Tax=Xenophilus arseniciresistens TaxID=1283306 RepID=A0AAE3N6Q1_9BURK|nr:NAD kinase [Xenophilus arseniciresistens]MDA7415539.1 NAD kinase [Xenophilus arseniciresistens]